MAKSPEHKELAQIKALLGKVLENQKRILGEERRIEKEESALGKEEARVEKEEQEVLSAERAQLAELEELESLEKEIHKDVRNSPLGKITFRDFSKSLIGALFGIVGHFAYHLGPEIAEHISIGRAIALYFVSLVIAVLFVYFAGFRKVDSKSLRWLPVRVGVIYVTSLAVIFIVLFLFGDITFEMHISDIFKTVSTISILAVLGASAADLIGKEESG